MIPQGLPLNTVPRSKYMLTSQSLWLLQAPRTKCAELNMNPAFIFSSKFTSPAPQWLDWVPHFPACSNTVRGRLCHSNTLASPLLEGPVSPPTWSLVVFHALTWLQTPRFSLDSRYRIPKFTRFQPLISPWKSHQFSHILPPSFSPASNAFLAALIST